MLRYIVLWSSLLVSFTSAVKYSKEALKDEVSWTSLPGAPSDLHDKFKMFAGYISIPGPATSTKNVFYWFFEAQTSPSEAPLVLWTNGGPGCSGFLGLLTEHGPFLVRGEGAMLVSNPYSWNLLANMLYVEQPAGVGFSYSDDVLSYKTGDDQAATDNVAFLQGWLDKFSSYRGNDLHISSESYGGHYMPTLAQAILDSNSELKAEEEVGKDSRELNLKGLLVGNPYTDWGSNQVAQYTKYWADQIISKPLYDSWMEKCVDGGYDGDNPACQSLEIEMDNEIASLNPYALDFPVCPLPSPIASSGGSAQSVQLHKFLRSKRLSNSQHPGVSVVGPSAEDLEQLQAPPSAAVEIDRRRALSDIPYEPCAENWSLTYLNTPEVKTAIHANTGIYWQPCSDKVMYAEEDKRIPMMPLYNKLIDNNKGFKVLVFSGDDDAVCATSGTQWWIWSLGYAVKSLWRPWIINEQVAGFATMMDGLSFVTVHGAGHEVPAYQPARGLELFRKYLDGTWFA